MKLWALAELRITRLVIMSAVVFLEFKLKLEFKPILLSSFRLTAGDTGKKQNKNSLNFDLFQPSLQKFNEIKLTPQNRAYNNIAVTILA